MNVERVSGGADAHPLLAPRIPYIPHASFDDPDARNAILAAMPGMAATEATRRVSVPEGLRPEMAGLHDVPVLSREQETHMFRQMNYLKCTAERARARLEPRRPRRADLEEFERLRGAAIAVRQHIVRANLRLVVSIACRFVAPAGDLAELVSEGNLALIRAVDKFDFARGYKFSTFATWVIMRHLARTLGREGSRRERLVPENAAIYRDTVDSRADASEQRREQDRRERVVARLLGRLDERERRIIAGRFGIGGGREQTLKQLGHELGISKERVRQIESSARGKLRRYACEVEYLLPSA